MMQKNNTGFTLIELLVVVLIIGILAAVAVPQYQNAVDKARYMELITIGDALHKAEEVYYLANNKYTTDPADLDLEFSLPANLIMTLGSDTDSYISLSNTQLPGLEYVFYLENHRFVSYRDRRECRTSPNSERLKKLCQNITGNSIFKSGSLWISTF